MEYSITSTHKKKPSGIIDSELGNGIIDSERNAASGSQVLPGRVFLSYLQVSQQTYQCWYHIPAN